MHTIGKRLDGSLLGEDEAGNLHRGTQKKIGHDKRDVSVTDNGDGTHTLESSYGGQLISRGIVKTIDADEKAAWVAACKQLDDDYAAAKEQAAEKDEQPPDSPNYPPKPAGFDPAVDKYEAKREEYNVQVIRVVDGVEVETTKAREAKLSVVDWEAM